MFLLMLVKKFISDFEFCKNFKKLIILTYQNYCNILTNLIVILLLLKSFSPLIIFFCWTFLNINFINTDNFLINFQFVNIWLFIFLCLFFSKKFSLIYSFFIYSFLTNNFYFFICSLKFKIITYMHFLIIFFFYTNILINFTHIFYFNLVNIFTHISFDDKINWIAFINFTFNTFSSKHYIIISPYDNWNCSISTLLETYCSSIINIFLNTNSFLTSCNVLISEMFSIFFYLELNYINDLIFFFALLCGVVIFFFNFKKKYFF